MLTGVYPRAIYRPVEYCDESSPFRSTPLGWILHVVVGNCSPFGTFEHAPRGNRRFSTLWIGKDGRVEQYAPLQYKPWAQSAGNSTYWAVETEGFPDEPLTDAQIDSLARWHIYSGSPDQIANEPGQRGIGTHVMGGVDWGNHECPGRIRAGQRQAILDRVAQIRSGNASKVTPVPAEPIVEEEEVMSRTTIVRCAATGKCYEVFETNTGKKIFYVGTPDEIFSELKDKAREIEYADEASMFADFPLGTGKVIG